MRNACGTAAGHERKSRCRPGHAATATYPQDVPGALADLLATLQHLQQPGRGRVTMLSWACGRVGRQQAAPKCAFASGCQCHGCSAQAHMHIPSAAQFHGEASSLLHTHPSKGPHHHTPATAGPVRAGGRRQRRSASPAPAAPPPSACLRPPTSPERGLRRRGKGGWRGGGIGAYASRQQKAGCWCVLGFNRDAQTWHRVCPGMRDCPSAAQLSHVRAQQAGDGSPSLRRKQGCGLCPERILPEFSHLHPQSFRCPAPRLA